MPVLNIRHYLGLALLLQAPVIAAQGANDVIAECARISSTGDRILCLEDALRQMSAADLPSTAAEPETTVSAADAADPNSAADGAGLDAASTAGAAAVAGAATENAANTAAQNSSPATQEASRVPVSPATEPELGAEQVARQNDVEQEQVIIGATIVEHTLVGTGRLRLTLDNGQVWQQTGDDDDRVARKIRGQTDIAIEMWQSRSGGYRMHLLEADRTLRVRRIR